MTCLIPPIGWFCTRESGHPGPCAASPTDDYKRGVFDALASLTFEEANACRFTLPYSEVTLFRDKQTPLSRLLDLRKKRLTGA